MRPILIATRCRREVCPPRPLSLACSSHLSRTVGYPSRTLLPCWALRAGLCHGLVVRHRRSRFRYIESTEKVQSQRMFLDCETVSNPRLLIQQKYSKSTAKVQLKKCLFSWLILLTCPYLGLRLVGCGLSEEACLTPNERFDQDVRRNVEARVRQGVQAVLEEVLQEQMPSISRPATASSPPPAAASAMDPTPGTS